MSESTLRTRCVTVCTEAFNPNAEVHRFNGVVLENEELTYGANGPKLWPTETVKAAAETLTRRPVVNGHTYDARGMPVNEAVVGKVVKSGWSEQGWLYDMEVSDVELARKLHHGHLEVSLHAVGDSAGQTDDGAEIMADVIALDLAIVPIGGAAGNTVEQGAAAALSAADIATLLDASGAEDAGDGDYEVAADAAATEPLDPEVDAPEADDAGTESETEAQTDEQTQAQDGSDTTTPMSDDFIEGRSDPEAGADGEAEAEENKVVLEKEDYAKLTEAASQLASLREEHKQLKAEHTELGAEVETLRDMYVAALVNRTGFSAQFYEGRTISELRSALEEIADQSGEGYAESSMKAAQVALDENMPKPQTGQLSGSQLGAVVTTGADGRKIQAELSELEEKLALAKEKGWDGAATKLEAQVAEKKRALGAE